MGYFRRMGESVGSCIIVSNGAEWCGMVKNVADRCEIARSSA